MSEEPVDVNLDDASTPLAQGPDWIFQPGIGRTHLIFLHRRTGHLLLLARSGTEPPTEWAPV